MGGPSTTGEGREIEIRRSDRACGRGRPGRQRAGRRRNTAEHPVLARRQLPGGDEPRRVLEHRGPLCHRPALAAGAENFGNKVPPTPPSTWASSTSPSTTRRWPARAATARWARRRSPPPPTTRWPARWRRSASPPAGRRRSAPTTPRISRHCRTDRQGRPGSAIGKLVARAVLAWRANDGLERTPVLSDLNPPAPGPGVWQPNPAVPPATTPPAVVGLRLPGVRPLVLRSASQFRPGPAARAHEPHVRPRRQ